jgi:hypothetical protein
MTSKIGIDENALLVETIRGAVPPFEGVVIEGLHATFDPHPYCITPSHLRGDSPYLDGAAIERAEKDFNARCGMYCDPNNAGRCKNAPPRKRMDVCRERCSLPYKDHHVRHALILDVTGAVSEEQAKRQEMNDELKAWLTLIVEQCKKHDLIGIALKHKKL